MCSKQASKRRKEFSEDCLRALGNFLTAFHGGRLYSCHRGGTPRHRARLVTGWTTCELDGDLDGEVADLDGEVEELDGEVKDRDGELHGKVEDREGELHDDVGDRDGRLGWKTGMAS